MKNKKVIKSFIIAGTIIAILYSIIYSVTLFFVYTAFRPVKPENSADSPACITDPKDRLYHDAEYEIYFRDEQKRSFPWLISASETVTTKSFDGLNLNARFALQADSHNYIILMHGYRDSTKYISSYARKFYEKGFNVLVPGQRGHGWSEGKIVDLSAFTPYDVKSWAEFISSRDEEAKIAFWGVSMGGSTVMQASALELPPNVICCIEDCGFSSMWDEFVYQISREYHLPGKPAMSIFNLYLKRHLKIDSKKVSAANAVSKSNIPTLFIHGDADTYVPFYMLDIVYDSANCPKEKLIIEGASHARAAFVNPELYWKAVFAFLEKYF